jgi:cytochrome c biogenesis protein
MTSLTLGQGRAGSFADPFGRLGAAAWRTLTDVRFAVIQIIVIALFGLLGTMIKQLDSFAVHDPATYATEMAQIAARYDPLTILGVHVGPAMVSVFETLGFFEIFNAPWFAVLLMLLVISIVVCTLDRTPRLWRGVHVVHPVQPEPFYDLSLNERARFDEVALTPDELTTELRKRHFKVRSTTDAAGVTHLYGDRNQYFKLATLITHAGLILFLVGGAVTGAFGFETVLFVGDGQTAPVQPVGTPDNLLIKNMGFQAPERANGSFIDFRTDLAVYQGGKEIARQTIRVNTPLTVDGYTFHQNTFGPAEDLTIRDSTGALVWQGPMIMEGQAQGKPQGFLTIPGSSIGLFGVLEGSASSAQSYQGSVGSNAPALTILGVTQASDGSTQPVFAGQIGLGQPTDPAQTAGYSITWTAASAFSGMVVKHDPGQPIIWLAYLCLISGLALTFYLPRRRLWARLEPGPESAPGPKDGPVSALGPKDDAASRPGNGAASTQPDRRLGTLRLAMLSDRYVDADREFGSFLDALADRSGRFPERGAMRSR